VWGPVGEGLMPATEPASAIPELSVVALTHPVRDGDKVIPEGATGAVVFVYRDGKGYEVEFEKPFHCVVTVRRDDIRLA
jgi:hypothetical protein